MQRILSLEKDLIDIKNNNNQNGSNINSNANNTHSHNDIHNRLN